MKKKPQELYTLCILAQQEYIIGEKWPLYAVEQKLRNIIFITGSSMIATVFAYTCTLPKPYSKDDRSIESRHDITLIK